LGLTADEELVPDLQRLSQPSQGSIYFLGPERRRWCISMDYSGKVVSINTDRHRVEGEVGMEKLELLDGEIPS
jgi:hypothetical protein